MPNSKSRLPSRPGRSRAARLSTVRLRTRADVVHSAFVAITLIASIAALFTGLWAAWHGLDNIVSTLTMLIGVSGVGLTAVQTVPAIVRHIRQAWRAVGYVCVVVLVMATSYSIWVVAHRPVIKIAVSMPFLGEDPGDAQAVLNGVQLAVGRQPDADGVPIEVVPFDDHDLAGKIAYMTPDGRHTQRHAESLRDVLDDAQIAGIIGPFHSDTALYEIPIVSEAGIPMISPSNTLNCLTDRGNRCGPTVIPRDSTYYRLAVSDDIRAAELVERLVTHLSQRRSGDRTAPAEVIIAEDQTKFGQGFAESFAQKWREKRPSDHPVRMTVADARNRIQTMPDGPALVLYSGTGIPAENLYKDVMTQPWGRKIPFVAPATIMNGGFSKGARTLGELYAAVPSPYDDTRGPGSTFADRYRRLHREDPSPYAAAAYDATGVLIKAVKEATKGAASPPPLTGGPLMQWRADEIRKGVLERLRTFNRKPGSLDYEDPAIGLFWFSDNGDVVFGREKTAIYQYGADPDRKEEWQFVRPHPCTGTVAEAGANRPAVDC